MTDNYTTLIEADQAHKHLSDAKWRFLDCQFDLMDADAGRAGYLQSHLPGAVFVDLNRDLSSPPTAMTGRHPLPDMDALAAKIRSWGIDNDTQVVAYDGGGGVAASRLWWALRWLGHNQVAVLNGGLKYWASRGFPLGTEQPVVNQGNFKPRTQAQLLVDADGIVAAQQAGAVLLDARTAERYRGEREPIDPIAGHIPGALNYFQGNNLQESGLFKSAADLHQQIAAVIGSTPPQNIIHYCGSGVSACHNLLAMEHIGMSGSKLYPGSWSEWIRDSNRPVEK